MNENFHKAMAESGMTMYQISKETGISYSLINDLGNNKKAINQRTVDQVGRIAAVLGKSINEIMDPYCVVEGITGNVDGIRYKVGVSNNTMFIDIYDGGKSHRIIKNQIYCVPRFRKIYELAIAESVRRYLEEKEKRAGLEARARDFIKRRNCHGN